MRLFNNTLAMYKSNKTARPDKVLFLEGCYIDDISEKE